VNAIADGWMQTLNGGRFYPGAPRPEDLNIYDIAGALSKICRFGGHCVSFYSVAEHSILVAEAAPPEHKLAALMHDASEAYLCDVPRPLKPLLPGYREIEDRLMTTLAERFGFAYPLADEVKRLDNAILADEREQNMTWTATPALEWGLTEPAIGVELELWSPRQAEHQFIKAFRNYGGRA
jgi:hypothetical protein